MIFNMNLKGAAGGSSGFSYVYSGKYAESTNAEGKTVIRLNTSGKLTITEGKQTVDVLVQAGGGGGGCYYAGSSYKSGGGGGGGYDTTQVFLTAGSEYNITIGSGGEGKFGSASNTGNVTGTDGGNTIAFDVTCTGGGGGGAGQSSFTKGKAGTPNGEAGTTTSKAGATGGAPNGGAGTVSAEDNNGGDGYVELTFV